MAFTYWKLCQPIQISSIDQFHPTPIKGPIADPFTTKINFTTSNASEPKIVSETKRTRYHHAIWNVYWRMCRLLNFSLLFDGFFGNCRCSTIHCPDFYKSLSPFWNDLWFFVDLWGFLTSWHHWPSPLSVVLCHLFRTSCFSILIDLNCCRLVVRFESFPSGCLKISYDLKLLRCFCGNCLADCVFVLHQFARMVWIRAWVSVCTTLVPNFHLISMKFVTRISRLIRLYSNQVICF